MKPKIAVFGNATNGGFTIAADLTLAGYEVNFLDLPKFEQNIELLKETGGIHLSGESQALVSGKTGLAKLKRVTINVKEAVKDTDVVFCDLPILELEKSFEPLAPYLQDGQIVYFNTYGYWSSLRAAKILKEYDKKNVILTDSPVPIYSTRGSGGHVTSNWYRRRIPIAAFPAKKGRDSIEVIKTIYPNFEMVKNVLQTNFENLNMLVHAGIGITNIGYFDRAEEKQETVGFYSKGNTSHAAVLTETQDRERIPVCRAYSVQYSSVKEHISRYYLSKGRTLQEVIKNCEMYQRIPPLPSNIWKQWLKVDVPLAHIPFVLLAELAGLSVPIHRAIITIVGSILEKDFWRTGLTLEILGIANLTPREVIKYVTEGE